MGGRGTTDTPILVVVICSTLRKMGEWRKVREQAIALTECMVLTSHSSSSSEENLLEFAAMFEPEALQKALLTIKYVLHSH